MVDGLGDFDKSICARLISLIFLRDEIEGQTGDEVHGITDAFCSRDRTITLRQITRWLPAPSSQRG